MDAEKALEHLRNAGFEIDEIRGRLGASPDPVVDAFVHRSGELVDEAVRCLRGAVNRHRVQTFGRDGA